MIDRFQTGLINDANLLLLFNLSVLGKHVAWRVLNLAGSLTGWIDESMDGMVHGAVAGSMDGLAEERTGGYADGQTDRQTDFLYSYLLTKSQITQ